MSTATQTLGQLEARLVEQRTGIRIPDDPRRRSRLQLRLAQSWARPGLPPWEAGRGICKVCAKAFCAPGEDIAPLAIKGSDTSPPTTLPIALSVCGDGRRHLPRRSAADPLEENPDFNPNSCAALVTEHYAAGLDARDLIDPAAVTLTPNWDEKCPPRFKSALSSYAETNQLPPAIDPAAFARVTAWRYDPTTTKGLYLVGPSGTGKTTSFWALARALEHAGTAPFVLTSLELSRQLAEAARDIKAVPWLARARVLMVDDLGKERPSPGASALLWEVLDQRYSHGLPVIATSRFPSDQLAARFGEQSIGEDIVRRLFQLCDGVKFTQRTQSQAQQAPAPSAASTAHA